MERARLKNIIILILALLNLFLAGYLSVQHLQAKSAHNRIAQELSQLFAGDSIALNADVVPFDSAPLPRIPVRNTEEDRLLAAFFLGNNLNAIDEGGGIYTCRSSAGEALFRYNGSFDIRLLSSAEDAETLIQRFCETYGYHDLTWNLNIQGESGTVSAVQYVDGYPVVDAVATFHVEKNRLTSVSGIHLPQSTTTSEGDAITAATALTIFLQERRSSGAVVSAVSDVYPCYRLQTTTVSPMSLSPAWCIDTNTGKYYVNSSTGTVTLP